MSLRIFILSGSGFYTKEKLLERCEMRYDGKTREFLDMFHVTNIIEEFTVMLIAVILE